MIRFKTFFILCLLVGLVHGAHFYVNRYQRDTTGDHDDHAPHDAHGDDETATHPHLDDAGGHGNDSHGNDSHGDAHHDGHHGVHVASWQFEYVRSPLIICLFLIVTAICKLGFHHANFLSSIVPESCLLIVLGTVIGAILHVSGTDKKAFAHFSSELFFLFLLPPIILESAYSLHDRVFIDNLGTVVLYAVVGTILNCFIIGVSLYGLAICGAMGKITLTLIECFVFSSLIVAVDPVAVLAIFQEIGVNTVLYFLVFGESLLNDAVTVVLYNMMKTFIMMEEIPPTQIALGFAAFCSVSLGGLTIGIMFGALTSWFTKFTEKVRVVEPLALFTLAYTAYLSAELFHFSGIISIIGCGLVQAQYAFHNIGHKSLTTVKYFTKMLSTTCDCIIFLFLGLAMVHEFHVWHPGFIVWSLTVCFVVRFVVVYSLTFLANKLNRIKPINLEEQFIMAYGGLRGAVAFSLVAMLDRRRLEHQDMFETTTLIIIVFTVFIQGITIKPLVKLLRISQAEEKIVSIYEEINLHVTDHVMAGIEEILGRRGGNFIREWLDHYDDKYFKHWLQRYPQSKDDHIMELYQKIAMQLHYENTAGQGYASEYGSQMELYKPTLLGDDEDLDELPDPCVLDQMLDARLRDPRGPSPTLSPLSGDEDAGSTRSASPPPTSRRASIFDILKPASDDPSLGHVKDDVTVNDIRKWVVKNPNDFHKKYDKNLTQEDRSDLIHQLYEKQRRTARLRRASLAGCYSPSSSIADSSEHVPASPRLLSPTLGTISEDPDGDVGKKRHRLKKAMTLDAGLKVPAYKLARAPRGKRGFPKKLDKSASMDEPGVEEPLLAEEERLADLNPPPEHKIHPLGEITEEPSLDLDQEPLSESSGFDAIMAESIPDAEPHIDDRADSTVPVSGESLFHADDNTDSYIPSPNETPPHTDDNADSPVPGLDDVPHTDNDTDYNQPHPSETLPHTEDNTDSTTLSSPNETLPHTEDNTDSNLPGPGEEEPVASGTSSPVSDSFGDKPEEMIELYISESQDDVPNAVNNVESAPPKDTDEPDKQQDTDEIENTNAPRQHDNEDPEVPIHRIESHKGMLKRQGHTRDDPADGAIDEDPASGNTTERV